MSIPSPAAAVVPIHFLGRSVLEEGQIGAGRLVPMPINWMCPWLRPIFSDRGVTARGHSPFKARRVVIHHVRALMYPDAHDATRFSVFINGVRGVTAHHQRLGHDAASNSDGEVRAR